MVRIIYSRESSLYGPAETIIEILLNDIEKMLIRPAYRPRYKLINNICTRDDVLVIHHKDEFIFMDYSETEYFSSRHTLRCINEVFCKPLYISKRYRDPYIYINCKSNRITQKSMAKAVGVNQSRITQIIKRFDRMKEYYDMYGDFDFIKRFPYCKEFMKLNNISNLDDLKKLGKKRLYELQCEYWNNLDLMYLGGPHSYYIDELIDFAIKFNGENTFDSVNRFFASLYIDNQVVIDSKFIDLHRTSFKVCSENTVYVHNISLKISEMKFKREINGLPPLKII